MSAKKSREPAVPVETVEATEKQVQVKDKKKETPVQEQHAFAVHRCRFLEYTPAAIHCIQFESPPIPGHVRLALSR